ncbi:fumarylacetoacetate hydrolase family protein [Streptomyces sp. NPDC051976]|uniref:fumarylacetoacetate hydrolase family protein n=1 Tax=Streptomyces sp. NPDC051976 TaxID=3154947 RepID=UPI00342AE4C0
MPDPMLAFVASAPEDRDRAISGARTSPAHLLHKVRVLAPFPRPRRNIFCVGKNYHQHAAEFHASGFDIGSRTPAPDAPVFFTKATTSVVGPGETIRSGLDVTGTTDYEGELAVVIGTGGRAIAADDAMDHVFGYTIFNDVTSRELQRRHGQWFLGKSIDTYGPMGPYLVTSDEISDPAELGLTVEVNGEVRQAASLSDLIFGIPALIECLSMAVTLEPGDVIATGTPAGVGIGCTPPRYLALGDTVTVRIDGLGVLTNPVG